MAGRKRSIRYKIFTILLVPVTALVVIWGFLAAVTIERGLELLRIQAVYDNVVVPVRGVIAELQHERFVSVHYLSTAIGLRSDLDTQRRRTDAAAATLERLSQDARSQTPPAMWDRVQELLSRVHRLSGLRGQVDDRSLSRPDAVEEYSALTEIGFQAYDRLMISPDLDLVEQTKAVILIDRSREIASQQSALITGAFSAGRMTQSDRDVFAGLVAKRRQLYQLGTGPLDAELSKPFAALNISPLYTSFVAMEDDVFSRVTPGKPLPSDALAWPTTGEALVQELGDDGAVASRTLAARALPLAQTVLFRIAAAGLLGLIAVLATGFISFRFARKLTSELGGLHEAALELADRRLPGVVDRLRRGEDVDVAAETPPLVEQAETVEVESVGNAFTSVQRTAVEAAVGQAKLRKGVNNAFLNLARRSQSLLQRQLSLLDGLEQEITDPELLERLFGVDHLTTRMRRHAEGLIILSGSAPGRGWRNPVSLYDVVRAAVEEVEDYLRVAITVPQGPALVGSSVTDLVHLLAELIENAAIFSPPNNQVHVRGEAVARGFALEVEDRGLGISPEEMTHLNERLANPPEFDLADSDRLGLFVVGLLARRHGVRVSLRPSPYGGTSAVVLIPKELVVDATARPFTADRLAPPAPVSAPALALTSPSGPPAAEDTLPKRVRQSSLAPQLREERRDVYSSFQAGWQRAQEES
ncbi:nitrate- and nitrite sensing domain-containing protein [Microbispora sp. NPDC049125]|uniref:sensor histidine kinase n=1 Tax=Microbispora sp. NPDC049125 TaxID=3154929 RepID=UPI003465EB24